MSGFPPREHLARFLARHPEAVFGITTLGPVRSLNLANAAPIVVYEALRQVGALAATTLG